MLENEYVKPPKRSTSEYVKPPKRNVSEDIQSSESVVDEYLKKLERLENNSTESEKRVINNHSKFSNYKNSKKVTEQSKSHSVKKVIYNTKKQNSPSNESNVQSNSSANNQLNNDSYTNLSYFGTPKVDFEFYLTGYIVLSMIPILVMDVDFTLKLITLAYFLLSNYTYSWFADYQRYKGGSFAWIFRSFGSAKAGWASSRFANYQTTSVKSGVFGGLKIKSHNDYVSHFFHIVIVTLVLELLKYYVISIPFAFISLFIHKSTIKKYHALIDERTKMVGKK